MTENKRNKWTKKELDQFKTLILEKRKEVVLDLKDAKEKANEVLKNNSNNAIYSSHMADAVSDQQEMEKNYYMMDRGNSYLKYINRALEMIKDGSFGICSSCGVLINKERLIEVPHTASCFNCKSQTS